MKKRPDWLRNLEQTTSDIADGTVSLYKKVLSETSKQANKLDDEYEISESLKKAGKSTKEFLSEADDKYSISDKASVAVDTLSSAGSRTLDSAKESGLVGVVDKAQQGLKDSIAEPIAKFSDDSGLNAQLEKLLNKAEVTYGQMRSIIKPYYAPETPIELLESTKEELIYINSCILQISADEAEMLANKLGSAVISKIAGAASAGVLLTMVSAYGTAGTGTAIAGLSGAAATNATLAWVGGLLGGGMATGAVMTGGLALAVGVGVYKLVGSEARQFDQLSETEQRIIESTGFLIAAINDLLKSPEINFDAEEAHLLLNNTLLPLYSTLQEEAENITKNLDSKQSVLFRQHALVDFKKRVIDGFEYFINDAKKSSHLSAEFVIAGVIYSLLTQTAVDDSIESQIALDALRRMKNDWNDASEAQLSDAISDYDPEQLKGIANNVKGIYHELLFVDTYNKENQETYAELFGATNHPGADVQIKSVDDNSLIREFQLKSTSSTDYVNEHVERYPNIEVLVTEEVAEKSSFESSGISNDDITAHINDVIEKIGTNTVFDRAIESGAYVGLAAAGKEVIDLLRGKQDMSGAGEGVAKAAGLASSSTLIASFLFS